MTYSGFAAGVGISPYIFCTEQIGFEREEQGKNYEFKSQNLPVIPMWVKFCMHGSFD